MSLSKRIVILSEVNGKAKGYITFFNGASGLSGELRSSPMVSDGVLAICVDGACASYELKKGQNVYSFRVPNAKQISGEISALIKSEDLLIFGSTAENRTEAFEVVSKLVEQSTIMLNGEQRPKPDVTQDVGGQENVHSIQPEVENPKVLSLDADKPADEPFYKLVEEQVTRLMQSNPTDEVLESLVVDSKWAKIACDDNLSYSLGIIKEEGRVKYICYAIPSSSGFNPPNHLSEFCQWLPLSANENEKNGFMVMYQNADNGENLKLNF